MTRNKIGQRKLNAGAALAAATVVHALLVAFATDFFTQAEPVMTPPRLQMTFVVPTPAVPVIDPVPQDQPPPPVSKPKPQPRPVAKKPVVPNPSVQALPPEPEPVVVSDPAPPAPVVVEPAPAAIAPVAESAPAPLLVAPIFEADYLDNPKPAYPPAARRLRLQGTVIVRVTVTTEGKPSEVRVVTSSGAPILDQAALAAVQTWLFVPARRGTNAVYADVDVPIRFSLN